METSYFLGGLFLLTAGLFIVFAIRSKARTKDKLESENEKKSTLAADAPDR